MKLHHKVRLSLFQDDAGSGYGVAPIGTIDNRELFNSAWSGKMIFHDIFEHYCEYQHPWFRGEYAMNVAGEMFAMGHFYYYAQILGIQNRYNSPCVTKGEAMIKTTLDLVQETIENGSCSFGDKLKCSVPFQKDTNYYDFEAYIDDYIYRVKQFRIGGYDENDKEFARKYKKSVTESKIKRLHRAGFYAAQKLVPNNDENRMVLTNFIDFWNNFTKQNNAEELYNNGLRHIDFEIYIDDNEVISWKALGIVDPAPFGVDIEITEKFCVDDLYPFQPTDVE